MSTHTADIQTEAPVLHIPASALLITIAMSLVGWLLLGGFAYGVMILS